MNSTYEVQDLALDDKIVEPIHHLLDTGVPVPPVDIKDVDIRSAQFLETRVHADMH
jgi:hypothetical protein